MTSKSGVGMDVTLPAPSELSAQSGPEDKKRDRDSETGKIPQREQWASGDGIEFTPAGQIRLTSGHLEHCPLTRRGGETGVSRHES